jgi:hypothetical protein
MPLADEASGEGGRGSTLYAVFRFSGLLSLKRVKRGEGSEERGGESPVGLLLHCELFKFLAKERSPLGLQKRVQRYPKRRSRVTFFPSPSLSKSTGRQA